VTQLIELNPDIVRLIVDQAREYQMKESLEGSEQPDEFEATIEDWTEREPTADTEDYRQMELVNTINDLEPDQQICLVGLMWLGRGDFDVEEWDTALEEAGQAHNNRTAQYLIATPLLADYLEEGLRLHGYDAE
jgi:hypothetical protein